MNEPWLSDISMVDPFWVLACLFSHARGLKSRVPLDYSWYAPSGHEAMNDHHDSSLFMTLKYVAVLRKQRIKSSYNIVARSIR